MEKELYDPKEFVCSPTLSKLKFALIAKIFPQACEL